MTRDEAIEILKFRRIEGNFPRCDVWVDALEALGVLHLDMPETATDRAHEAITKRIADGAVSAGSILMALERAGLKVVEA